MTVELCHKNWITAGISITTVPGGKGPLINTGIIGGGPLGSIPLGGRGGRCIGRGGCKCGGGASPKLKKLLDISTGGGGKATRKIKTWVKVQNFQNPELLEFKF